ncbi:MAG: SEC-C metal-binding domain-containing protein [bacterium]
MSGNDYCPCGSGKKFKKCCGMISPDPASMIDTTTPENFIILFIVLLGFSEID